VTLSKTWLLGLVVAICGTLAAGIYWGTNHLEYRHSGPQAKGAHDSKSDDHGDSPTESEPPLVKTVRPALGAMERICVVPGSIHAYEYVDLYAKVSGFLRKQPVDIGDRVKKKDVLAELDVPELDKLVQKNQASVEQALAKVEQMKARVVSVRAEREATKAAVIQTEAAAKSAAAWVRYRTKQLSRMKELHDLKSIDERLVDETMERFEASVETERSAVAAITTAKANVDSVAAKILQAQADVVAAESEVKVARAELERAQVQQDFSVIRAPFDGVITRRSLFPGDFVRSANEGTHSALLTVQRMDRMRVVVQIPDRDVPYADPGDPATVEIDALPGRKFEAKISRIASTEDPHTRLMQVEIDLPNPNGQIRQGMYGKVTMVLDKAATQLSLPSICLVGRSPRGGGSVYVVRDGKARLTPVRVGTDNGLRVAVLEGLHVSDEVILRPGSDLVDGAPIRIAPPEATAQAP
jgi:HlyD family secretion protein